MVAQATAATLGLVPLGGVTKVILGHDFGAAGAGAGVGAGVGDGFEAGAG